MYFSDFASASPADMQEYSTTYRQIKRRRNEVDKWAAKQQLEAGSNCDKKNKQSNCDKENKPSIENRFVETSILF